MSETTPIKPRDLTPRQKRHIKEFLKYGDVRKIADRCQTVGYQRVSDILRLGEDHDEVWREALAYLNELPRVRLNAYLARFLEGTTGYDYSIKRVPRSQVPGLAKD